MSTLRERFRNNLTAITPFLILGAGFVALFAGFSHFYLIWILGFVVVLPIIAILFDEDGDEYEYGWSVGEEQHEQNHDNTESPSASSTQDALTSLRERYAQGDLTDEQFERKLDRLLETETPEDAAEWRTREREVETEERR